MGGCMSTVSGGGSPYIASNDGGEEEFHARYVEGDVLGEGEFGAVKLCTDLKGSDELAVKILKKGIVFKDNTLYSPLKPEVLQAECDILRELDGKNYCLALKGIYETPKVIYVVTELCSGGEMMEYVSKRDELRTEDVSRISFQLLSAISHCATHRIIHRDLKAENIMFQSNDPNAEIRLIDFGCGAFDKQSPPLSTKEHSTFAGTAFYCSPELFQRTYTSKTDVWSAGVVLYVLVAGYPADELQKAFNVLHTSKRSKRNLRSLPNLPSNLPDSFFDLLEQLLLFHHKSRPTAGAMLDHEFVQFHNVHSGKRRMKASRTASVLFKGSVSRHGLVLQYQKFERAMTTILATVLSQNDLENLLDKLDERMDINASDKRLDVIPIGELKAMLKRMKQHQCVDMIDNLPNARSYDSFAYHIGLLKQFSRMKDTGAIGSAAKRSMSVSVGASAFNDSNTPALFNGNGLRNHSHNMVKPNGMIPTRQMLARAQSAAVVSAASKPLFTQSVDIVGRMTNPLEEKRGFESQKANSKLVCGQTNGGVSMEMVKEDDEEEGWDA